MRLAKILLGILVLGTFADAEFHPVRGMLNALPAMVIICLGILVFNQRTISVGIGFLITIFLYLASGLKLKYWGAPLTPSDSILLYNVSGLWDLMWTYVPAAILYGLGLMLLIFFVAVIRIAIARPDDKWIGLDDPRYRYKRGRNIAIALVIIAGVVMQVRSHHSLLYRVYDGVLREDTAGFMHLEGSLNRNGLFVYLIAKVPTFRISYHAEFGPEEIQAFHLDHKALFEGNPSSVKPDIIVVLNESAFDPGIVDIPTSNILPDFFLFSDQSDTILRSHLNVHTFGGGTWVTEYNLLAGMDTQLFGPSGQGAPYTLAYRTVHTLPKHLKQYGYRSGVIAPIDISFMNAKSAYGHYGFDADLLDDPYTLGHPTPNSWAIPDDYFIRQIQQKCDALDQTDAPPHFWFVLTMGNHGPHLTDFDGGMISKLPLLESDRTQQLNHFLNRLVATDEAMAALVKYIQSRKRPTLCVFFGDHHPSFSQYLTPILKAPYNRYTTYVHMVANYPLPQALRSMDVVDVIYLPGLILDAVSLNSEPFFQINSLMRQTMDGSFSLPDDPLLHALYYSYRDYCGLSLAPL